MKQTASIALGLWELLEISGSWHLDTMYILILFILSSVAILFFQTLHTKNEIFERKIFYPNIITHSDSSLLYLKIWKANFTVNNHFLFPIHQALLFILSISLGPKFSIMWVVISLETCLLGFSTSQALFCVKSFASIFSSPSNSSFLKYIAPCFIQLSNQKLELL